MKQKFLALALASATLALLWLLFPLQAQPLRPLMSAPVAKQAAASFTRSSLPKPPTEAVHAISVAALADDSLLALWYGGSREGARDVALYQSLYQNDSWQAAQPLLDSAELQLQLGRNIKTIGNPVLFRHPGTGRLWLFFVSTSYGGWSGSTINFMYRDDGKDWSQPQRLLSAPMLNFSTLVKYPPLALAEGELLLPAYHEMIGKYSELLRLSSSGDLLGKYRISSGRRAIQPSLHFDGGRLHAFMRNSQDQSSIECCKLWQATATGPEWNFDTMQLQPLRNPNSAAASLSLDSSQALLAYNDHPADRSVLSLKLYSSATPGWGRSVVLQQQADGRYSYPWLLADNSGTIHLFYTQDRQSFAHISFNRAWVDANL